MSFIKTFKNNWKYILGIILIIIGVFLKYFWQTEKDININEEQINPAELKTNYFEIQNITDVSEKIIVDLQKFNTIENAVEFYLNQYSNQPDILKRLFVNKKGWPDPVKLIPVSEKIDFNKDGLKEIMMCHIDPLETVAAWAIICNLSIFSKEEKLYKPSFAQKEILYTSHYIKDINNDNKPELIIIERSCGAAYCFYKPTVIKFYKEGYRNITKNVGPMKFANIQWIDKNDDGFKEIIMSGDYEIKVFNYIKGEYQLINPE